jgi:hypothetical protein
VKIRVICANLFGNWEPELFQVSWAVVGEPIKVRREKYFWEADLENAGSFVTKNLPGNTPKFPEILM